MTFYLKSICIAILVCAIVCNGQVSSQDDQHLHHHHHHHGHQHHDHIDGEEQTPERPSFKYSREANIRTSNEANPQQRSDRFSDHSHHSHDSHSHHSHPHTHDSHSTIKKDVSSVWVSALGSTLLISLAPYIILFFIPLDNSPKYESWLKVLLAFASGGLLGDAFLHLIPHAMSGESGDGDSHDHHHSHGHSHSSSHSHSHSHNDGNESEPHSHDLSVGLWVLAGIIVFLMVEKFVRIVNGGQHSHSHSVTDSAHERKHTQTSDDLETDTKPAQTETSNLNGDQQQNDTKDAQSSSDASNKDDDENRESETDKSESELNSDNTQRKRLDSSSSSNSQSAVGNIKISGYLNLAADFTHNLTDGLAIGASFLAGKNIGIVTTITILLHEIPHEIGDFAILIQSGCSRQKAMQLQLITAVGAFTGTAISLFTEGLGDSASSWILPFTAGGFIYIATVSVIPELLENNKFWQSVKELSALLVGISMMVIIARYE